MQRTDSKAKCRIVLIIIISIAVAAALIFAGIAIFKKPNETPVPSDRTFVTIQGETCGFFSLDGEYCVTAASSLVGHDSDLLAGTDGLIPFEEACRIYLENLAKAQKLGMTKDDVILFAVESTDKNVFDELSAVFKAQVKQSGSEASVYSLYIKFKNDDTQKLADENGESYAKAYLCETIAKQSGKLNAKDLISKSIPEILNALVAAKPEIDDDVDGTISDIIDDANKEQEDKPLPDDGSSGDSSSEESSSTDSGSSESSGSSDSSDSSDSGSSDSSESSSGNFVVLPPESGWSPIV